MYLLFLVAYLTPGGAVCVTSGVAAVAYLMPGGAVW